MFDYENDEMKIVFLSMRYAFGSESPASYMVLDFIIRNWNKFDIVWKQKIQDELRNNLEQFPPSKECLQKWNKVLELSIENV